MKTSVIAKTLGITYQQIHRCVKNRRLKKKDKYATNGINSYSQYVINRKQNINYSVYDYINKSTEPISNNLYKSKYGKYTLNPYYFHVIDNEWKAYWLGFLYADGCVRHKISNKGKRINSLLLSLSSVDKNHIQKFLNSLQADYPIVDYQIHGYNVSKITITNEQLVMDLINKGCVPNKSKILKFPNESQVPRQYIKDFIRGYFDGNGYICIKKDTKVSTFSLLGTYQFLDATLNWMIDNIPHLEYKHKISQCKGENVYQFSYSKCTDVEMIYKCLYTNCNIYLDRKLQKFDSLYCLD